MRLWRWLLLAAIGLLPFRWLSPLASLSDRAILSDALVAAAFAAWLVAERPLRRRALTATDAMLGGLAALALASTAVNHGAQGAGVADLLSVWELLALVVLCRDLVRVPAAVRWLRRVLVADALAVGGLVVVGQLLFYAGVHTGLLDSYGALTQSSAYARTRAGFESAPLLSSWAIFALAAIWQTGVRRPGRASLPWIGALAVAALFTFSRGIVGLAVTGLLLVARDRAWPRWVSWGAACAGVLVVVALSVGQLHIDPGHPWRATYSFAHAKRRARAHTGLRTVARHPWLGSGPRALVARRIAPGEPRLWRPHMTLIDIAGTLGIPALLVLLALVGDLWRRTRAAGAAALWAGMVGLGIDGIGQDADHFRHVWVMVGLLAAAAVGVRLRRAAAYPSA